MSAPIILNNVRRDAYQHIPYSPNSYLGRQQLIPDPVEYQIQAITSLNQRRIQEFHETQMTINGLYDQQGSSMPKLSNE